MKYSAIFKKMLRQYFYHVLQYSVLYTIWNIIFFKLTKLVGFIKYFFNKKLFYKDFAILKSINYQHKAFIAIAFNHRLILTPVRPSTILHAILFFLCDAIPIDFTRPVSHSYRKCKVR